MSLVSQELHSWAELFDYDDGGDGGEDDDGGALSEGRRAVSLPGGALKTDLLLYHMTPSLHVSLSLSKRLQ